MAAALSAAEAGAAVTLLERRPKPGKKLLATGNGRCNLAHRGTPVYYGDPAFAARVMRVCPPESVMRRLEAWGLPLFTDTEGRVYPATQQASSVLRLLLARLEERGVRLLTDADVTQAQWSGDAFILSVNGQDALRADRLILATGGLAGGGLGNREEDYSLSAGFGHRITPLFAGLAPLDAALGRFKKLSGLRVPARVSLVCDRHTLAQTAGEVLFADYGLSGICVMQLARAAQEALRQGKQPALCLDLSPIFFPETRAYARDPADTEDPYRRTVALLTERACRFGRQGMLVGLVPEALERLCPTETVDRAARFLTAMQFTVTGVRPMANAQVTCGGVDTAEIDPQTMASRLQPHLYLAGELLNVDGDCGGYNLQFALATGMLAGASAARDC